MPCTRYLKMEDEAGMDGKVLARLTAKILKEYANIKTLGDIPEIKLKAIEHFFAHYKDPAGQDPGLGRHGRSPQGTHRRRSQLRQDQEGLIEP